MKKIFMIAAAVATLAACSKVEKVAVVSSDITFGPQAISTKALILPDSNSPEQVAFPTSEKFSVFAFVDQNYTTPLMNNVTIANQNGDWKALSETVYLWPATGSADFYAAYPAGAATFNKTSGKLEMAGVSLGTTIGSQVDPLVATTLAQDCAARPKVKVVFKHISSQVVVKAYDATETEALQGKIVLKNVEFLNMNTEGDYVDGTTVGKGSWSNQNGHSDFTVFAGETVLPIGIANESILSGDSFSGSIDNNSAFVTIPSVVSTQAIKVVYDIDEYKINGYTYPAVKNKVETIALVGRNVDNRFVAGRRYVYHIGISLDGANNEIMFSPVVEGWENEDVNGIVIDAANGGLL